MRPSRSDRGIVSPPSALTTVFLLAPTATASSACERPEALRAAAIAVGENGGMRRILRTAERACQDICAQNGEHTQDAQETRLTA